MSTWEGTFIHTVSPFLSSRSACNSSHKSLLTTGVPCFVLHPRRIHPASHSVAPLVTSCESTHNCSGTSTGVTLSACMHACSSALLFVCNKPGIGALWFRAWRSPNHTPYPAYGLPSFPVCCEPSVHTRCTPCGGSSSRLYFSMTSCLHLSFLLFCSAFLSAFCGSPGSEIGAGFLLYCIHCLMACLNLCADLGCTLVGSSRPQCPSSDIQNAMNDSFEGSMRSYRTSHLYLHSAVTADHINMPCSHCKESSGLSRQSLEGSTLTPCGVLTGLYRSLSSCIGWSRYGHFFTLCS
mmetsp:Transcript_103907/g.178998  ORF Transcript_103907/g.178998 Transcript_103907/m.178998 type:complete len:294 (+) Transcript_103907:339-1220(+)